MNILIEGLPCFIRIDGKDYAINADYQTALKIMNVFEDNSLIAIEKNLLLLELLYKDVPDNYEEAIKKGLKFLNCGEEGSETSGEGGARVYSFKKDAKYIFSGVDKVLNGRLSKGDLVHWWEFVMAFMELPEDCMMSKIIYYRTQFSKGRLSKEERKVYFDNRELFELPAELTKEEEKIYSTFMAKLVN